MKLQIQLENLKKQLGSPTSDSSISISIPLIMLPQLAKVIGNFLEAGDWLFLDGDLGAGKTALAKEISVFFGVKNSFTSPTFSILNSEIIKNSRSIEKILHLDLYRLKSGKELCFIGLEEEFKVKNSVALFEWPAVLEKEEWKYFFEITGCAKPKRVVVIKIETTGLERKYEFVFYSLETLFSLYFL